MIYGCFMGDLKLLNFPDERDRVSACIQTIFKEINDGEYSEHYLGMLFEELIDHLDGYSSEYTEPGLASQKVFEAKCFMEVFLED
jgi:hypothetical protein